MNDGTMPDPDSSNLFILSVISRKIWKKLSFNRRTNQGCWKALYCEPLRRSDFHHFECRAPHSEDTEHSDWKGNILEFDGELLETCEEYATAAEAGRSGDNAFVENCPRATRDKYGDSWCDVTNNHEACNWDGGDCCEDTCIDGILTW